MGIHKKDHIRALLRAQIGAPPDEATVEDLFAAFIPMQMDCLVGFSAVIAGVPETVEELRSRGIKIGSTTGYTRPMLDLLLANRRRARLSTGLRAMSGRYCGGPSVAVDVLS